MIVPEKQSIAIGDYQYLLNFSRYDDEPKTLNSDEFKIVDQLTEKSSLKLLLNSKDEVDFGPQILKLFKENKEKRGTVKVPELSMETDLGMYHVKLIFKDIMSEKQPYNNRVNIYYTDAYLLIKLK
jgi:hypothetical protein